VVQALRLEKWPSPRLRQSRCSALLACGTSPSVEKWPCRRATPLAFTEGDGALHWPLRPVLDRHWELDSTPLRRGLRLQIIEKTQCGASPSDDACFVLRTPPLEGFFGACGASLAVHTLMLVPWLRTPARRPDRSSGAQQRKARSSRGGGFPEGGAPSRRRRRRSPPTSHFVGEGTGKKCSGLQPLPVHACKLPPPAEGGVVQARP
jgi:hypothetical protein